MRIIRRYGLTKYDAAEGSGKEKVMEKTAEALIAQARAWLGCRESDGSHKKIIDIYNSHRPLARGYAVKYTDAWCAAFVSACAIQTGMTDIIPTECGCGEMVRLFGRLGEWNENDARVPKPGDIIFYDWQDNGSGDNTGNPDHVGIVEKVSGGMITVIEGNKNNAAGRRTLRVNGRYIRGYGVPKYDSIRQSASTPVMSVEQAARDVIAGKYGNGDARKRAVTALGLDYATVQKRVNEILKGGTFPKKSVEEAAREVIAGRWGNGKQRKRKLMEAGYDYAAVQKRVNELLRR